MEELDEMLRLLQAMKDKDLPKVQRLALQLQIMGIACQYKLLEGMAAQNGIMERQAKALESMANSAMTMEPR